MADVAISGKFYYRGAFRELTVGVTNGVITDIKKDMKAQLHYTVEGGIFPASTDTHVHFRDPGETRKEDFPSGSMSAVYGGTTTVLDMPNNSLPIVDYGRYYDKRAAIKGRSYCDYGLYSLFTGNNADVISGESIGIKIYLGGSTNSTGLGSIGENALEKLSGLQKRVVFHAESEECLGRHTRQASTLAEHDLARPVECEREGVAYVQGLKLPAKTVTHLSSLDSLKGIATRDFLAEVTPHHLLLNAEMDLGPVGKVNPPLRSKINQQEILQAYVDGKIDVVSSDHAPHTESDKDEFQFAKSGISGVETRVPVLLALVRKGILPMETFVRTTIEKPPESFGIRKGKIEPGYYADFMAVKMSEIRKVNEERLHSKMPFSPFNGFDAIFPETVFIRGSPVLEGGEILSEKQGNYFSGIKEGQNA